MKKVLTVAGSDSGGGAGIQADLKTFFAYGVYGMSVITAVTAQNTCGVLDVEELSQGIIGRQFEAVLSDIGTDALKTGMLANTDTVILVAEMVKRYNLKNIVVDPVMIAKSGDRLLSAEAVSTLRRHLIPLATVITPNLPEAEILLERYINNEASMREAAVELHKLGPEIVIIKGGHLKDKSAETTKATDIIFDGVQTTALTSDYIGSKNTHGTGCTFASAITAGLAKGCQPLKAIASAKNYISAAIKTASPLGKGQGPVNHFASTT